MNENKKEVVQEGSVLRQPSELINSIYDYVYSILDGPNANPKSLEILPELIKILLSPEHQALQQFKIDNQVSTSGKYILDHPIKCTIGQS